MSVVITVTGNLGSDPVLRESPTGKAVTTLNIASNDMNGNATWYSATLWENQAENAVRYLKKGSLVQVVAYGTKIDHWTHEGQQYWRTDLLHIGRVEYLGGGNGNHETEEPSELDF